ncbi:fimbrial protein [Citrobacter amalonaticus]|uniref:Fimbrial protein n=1 Tax=Citrobacter amalonaticus TaxID=35703 RepID=A0A2S4S4C5_CITAM|nr:spore coat U domain-containing protein [Citrobacter amalonaticus]POT60125.1 fimbrial protein [Citrobacter amalonaticus]POT78328.1 fimbrial protein [Citrobacter amalonaticus]POU68718.1 fimbrial protein [Citrobacter amalonaticus]POV08322.1 fimbrial protein [Citrobacter amalonaticus]
MRRVLYLLILLILSAKGWAACSVSTTSGAFGSVSSFTVNSTEQATSATLVVQCDVVLGLLNNDTVTLTYTGATVQASSRATLKRTDDTSVPDTIPVRMCSQSGCASNSEIAINGSYTWSGSTLLALLGSSRYTLPLYFRTVTGQNVSAGPYQVTLNFSVAYNICQVGLLGACITPQTGTLPATLPLNLTVTNDCITITAPDVNFGSAPLVKNFPSISQMVSVTCTKGSNYTIGINNGSYASGNVRNMASGSNRLSYEIYKASTTSRWGSIGSERWASSGASSVSSDGLMRTYNYTARILQTQATPPAGTYTDTVVVDIAF